MARAIWTGALSFGLVNVPVGLYSATEDKSIRFNQFQAGTSDRVRNKRVNERTGDEVPYDEIVKGYDLGGGEYVIVTPEELASVAPEARRTIDITDFVELGDIDPLYFDRSYYLAPQGKGSDRAYALLLEAMSTMQKVALGQFVMRDNQYLVAVRPHADALVLETLRFGDEVRAASEEIDVLPVEASFESKELDMAKLLIDSMATDWDPELYQDTYRERVEELIEQKRQGEVIVTEVAHEAPAPVVDLLAALQASVDAARGGGGRAKAPRAAKTAASPKRAPKGGGAAGAEAPRARKTAVAARRRNTTQTSRATPAASKSRSTAEETAKRSRRKAS
jgi:DNA end-binding protein Ku